MNAREALTVARILKVNHAGEYGAIRIYRAQIFVARRCYPDLLPFLQRRWDTTDARRSALRTQIQVREDGRATLAHGRL
jgi:ubiquinone biosynthesis monooxygenase Coq7